MKKILSLLIILCLLLSGCVIEIPLAPANPTAGTEAVATDGEPFIIH